MLDATEPKRGLHYGVCKEAVLLLSIGLGSLEVYGLRHLSTNFNLYYYNSTFYYAFNTHLNIEA